MALWMFWSSEALQERIIEVLEEALMGYDGDGNHDIKGYVYPPVRKETWENGKNSSEMRELRSQVKALAEENKKLSETVQSLSKEVQRLSEEVRSLRFQMKSPLKDRSTPDVVGTAGARRSVKPTPEQRQPAQEGFARRGSVPQSYVLFRENAGNEDRLRKFADEAENLKRNTESRLSENGDDKSAFLSLIDKCLGDFSVLRRKSADADAADLAEESAKILKKTVCKALMRRELKPYVEEYLRNCGVRKLEWYVGKKLTDKEYAYLEEPVFYDDVTDPWKNGRITKIEREGYYIDYEEDGRVGKALIPGTYHIGRYRSDAAYSKP